MEPVIKARLVLDSGSGGGSGLTGSTSKGSSNGLGGIAGFAKMAGAVATGTAILAGVSKLMTKLVEASPKLQASLNLMNKSIIIMLRPIGDIMGLFLKPLAIQMLKFAVPFYKALYNSDWMKRFLAGETQPGGSPLVPTALNPNTLSGELLWTYVWQPMIDAVHDFFVNRWDEFTRGLEIIWSWIETFFVNMKDLAILIYDKAWDWITAKWVDIKALAILVKDKVWEWISSGWDSVTSFAKLVYSAVKSYLKGFLPGGDDGDDGGGGSDGTTIGSASSTFSDVNVTSSSSNGFTPIGNNGPRITNNIQVNALDPASINKAIIDKIISDVTNAQMSSIARSGK